jgi:hypothetical protein
MDDEGVPGRALLGGEDGGDSGGVEGVGSEAVDGFGGEGDEVALAEEVGGALDVGGLGGVEMEGWGHAVVMVSPGSRCWVLRSLERRVMEIRVRCNAERYVRSVSAMFAMGRVFHRVL